MTELEDIYLPFRPKRRTRATIAKEKGLEPLAARLFKQDGNAIDVSAFIDPEKGGKRKTGMEGARDIIAEWISEDARIRSYERYLYETRSLFQSTVVKKKQEKPPNTAIFRVAGTISQSPIAPDSGRAARQRESFLTVHVVLPMKKPLRP